MQCGKGEVVEVSSDDDGFQGALYTAKIMKVLPGKSFLVEYETLVSDDGKNLPLQEKVDCYHLRPCPPQILRQTGFDVHEEVDAFHNDGWWVGVVVRVLSGGRCRVYFRDSGEEIVFRKSQLRVHQEWINGRWVTPSEALIKKSSMDLVLSSVSAISGTRSTSVEHELPISTTQPKRKPKLQVVRRKVLEGSFLELQATATNTAVENAEEIPNIVSAHSPNMEGLQSERYILPKSCCLEPQAGNTQTHGFSDDDDIDQTMAVITSNSQPKRKRRLISRPEVIPDETAYGSVESPNLVCEAEDRADDDHRSFRITSYKDELEMRAALSLPKVKAKLMTNEASKNTPNQTKVANKSFSDVCFIKVPYLKSSMSRVGKSDSGELAGYGSQKDVNKIAYHFLLQSLYLQGDHKWSHEVWLSEVRSVLGINNDDHSKELKRVTSGGYLSSCP